MVMKTEVIDIGDTVLCDSCNADYTSRPESGGFVFGSSAYCPECATRMMEGIVKYNEQRYIRAKCPEGMSFADFVRRYRNGNNRVVITSW